MVCSCTQPIQVETSPGKVEMAIMHAIEVEQTAQTDQRCAAMLHRIPMHAMLFSSTGSLIHGNNAAMYKVHALEGTACWFILRKVPSLTAMSLLPCSSSLLLYVSPQQFIFSLWNRCVLIAIFARLHRVAVNCLPSSLF